MKNKTPHRIIDGVDHKPCARCGKWKALDKFYNDKKAADGKTSYCKECKYKYDKDYYKSEEGHKICLDIRKRYYDRNKKKCMEAVKKIRDKIKDVDGIDDTIEL